MSGINYDSASYGNAKFDNRLFKMIHDFMLVHLPSRKNHSEHTAKAYAAAVEQLIHFIAARRKIMFENVTIEMFSADVINAWLDAIETERGCGVSTRNQRRAGVSAFLKYVADMDVALVMFKKEMKKVPVKKSGNVKLVGHMTETAVTALLNAPDAQTRTGQRDRFFLTLLYDLGARCSEMLDIQIKDLRLGATPTIILHGKGGKDRAVPLRPKTAAHLKDYMAAFHQTENAYSEQPLFYSIKRGAKRKLSTPWARKMIARYGAAARATCAEAPENVHCHLVRHSRAMHLYQHGMDLTLVSQWLGHAQLETTLVYAHADTEHKRLAIAAATTQNDPLSKKLNAERFMISDEAQLKKLCGLR